MSPLTAETASLHTMLVSDIRGEFFVPSYQRGYRWGEQEVTRLLSDIADVDESEPYYYLQPIVVRPREEGWELIDGQQRLTTLYLVLRALQARFGEETVPLDYDLSYETRPDSADFLKAPDKHDPGRNIDFHHMSEASSAIDRWLRTAEGKLDTGKALTLLRKITTKAAVIWYEVEDQDPRVLFTRLNVGRIPLTDSELVKAQVLTLAKGDTDWNDHAQEVAAQWDSIERDLRAPDLWAFMSGRSDDEPTHIGLLLDILAGGRQDKDRPLFLTFETLNKRATSQQSALDLWKDVVGLYSRILGWFEDHSLYHKIGYLIAQGEDLGDLAHLAETLPKDVFDRTLDDLIRAGLNLTSQELSDLRYRGAATPRALLLMNVETIRRRGQHQERFSFHQHASRRWSEEHIHAQNAEELKTEDDRRAWLTSHLSVLRTSSVLPDVDDLGEEIETALTGKVTRNVFDRLQQRVTDILSVGEGEDMHHISNLTLLDSGDNSALSNSVFEVKRREIIERDKQGSYIPVCTRNVFLKYYTPAAGQQLHFWAHNDRTNYLKEMVTVLAPYLKDDRQAAA